MSDQTFKLNIKDGAAVMEEKKKRLIELLITDSKEKILSHTKTKKTFMVAFVGGGGKTTAIYWLANELVNQYKQKVLITTSTNMWKPVENQGDPWGFPVSVIKNEKRLFNINKEAVNDPIVFGLEKKLGQGKVKLSSPGIKAFFQLKEENIFDIILIEADGSANRSVKAPANHEPAIPPGTNQVVGLIGLSAVGKPAEENFVHRCSRFIQITGINPGERIQTQNLVNLIKHPEGLFKATETVDCATLLLTQMRGKNRKEAFYRIKDALTYERIYPQYIDAVIGSDLKQGCFYR